MPGKTSSKLYQRTKSTLQSIHLPGSPSSSASSAAPSSTSPLPPSPPTSTLASSALFDASSAAASAQNVAAVTAVHGSPHSKRRGTAFSPPRKIGLLESWWIYYEGMFAGSMLETWEKVLLHSLLVMFLTLLALAASYLPGHLRVIASHARYYAYGTGDWTPR
ncbi:hypothetical protein JCM10212_003153 [Sporobolomyces blumeae]